MDERSFYQRIGSRLQLLRGDDTQEELAKILACEASTIRHWEKGRRRMSVYDLHRIARHYNVPITYFWEEATNEERRITKLDRLAEEFASLRGEVEELTGDMANLIWVPIRGTVPGGYPDFREEVELDEHFPIPKALIRDPNKAFALRVSGDSMQGRGIMDGDVVVVDMTLTAEVGDIIVVRCQDKAVLKTYRRDEKGPYLESANEIYKPFRLEEGNVLGVVVYAGREYRRPNRKV